MPAFPFFQFSDSSEPEEWDPFLMLGPEASLFAQFFAAPSGSTRHRESCPTCAGRGWIWVLPPDAKR